MVNDPERDRAEARRRRYGPRFAQSLGDLAQRWASSPEARNAQRHAKAVGVLRAVLPPHVAAKIHCNGLRDGVLTLIADDHIAMHEVMTVHRAALLDALIAKGCGVSKLTLRLAKS